MYTENRTLPSPHPANLIPHPLVELPPGRGGPLDPARPEPSPTDLLSYLAAARDVVQERLDDLLPADSPQTGRLYERMRDYPLRDAKGLRPALAIATCLALGGTLDQVAGSATALELFHNAFLLHDDVEDDSELRRHRPTMHREVGIPIAMNVGDGMLALALQPLLDNVREVGLGPALQVLRIITRMARETAEGQAMELEWIRENAWDLHDRDYLRMVHKKTSWYSFIAPILIGAASAQGTAPAHVARLGRFAMLLGAAFQIQDDVLNLSGTAETMGKEHAGDLWEGKHTLILMHALRQADDHDRRRAIDILGRPRPDSSRDNTLAEVVDHPDLPAHLRKRLLPLLHTAGPRTPKTASDIAFLLDLIEQHHSLDHARAIAHTRLERARSVLAACDPFLPPSPHRRVLEDLVEYVLHRRR